MEKFLADHSKRLADLKKTLHQNLTCMRLLDKRDKYARRCIKAQVMMLLGWIETTQFMIDWALDRPDEVLTFMCEV